MPDDIMTCLVCNDEITWNPDAALGGEMYRHVTAPGVRRNHPAIRRPKGPLSDAEEDALVAESLPSCPATATIEPGGGLVRCSLLADGHTTHEVVLTWQDGEGLRAEWPEAYDPAETFDVEVDPENVTVDPPGADICGATDLYGGLRCQRAPHPASSYHVDGGYTWGTRGE